MDFTKAFIFFCLKLGEIYLALNHIVPACIKRLHPQLLSHKILTFSGGEGGGGVRWHSSFNSYSRGTYQMIQTSLTELNFTSWLLLYTNKTLLKAPANLLTNERERESI